MSRRILGLLALSSIACSGSGGSGTSFASGTDSNTDSATSTSTASTTSTGTSTTTTGSTSGTKFDMAVPPPPDMGGYDGPIIPETCVQASQANTTVGCLFYGVDGNNQANSAQFAIAVSNVQQMQDANVVVEMKVGANWMPAVPMETVGPLSLHVFNLPNLSADLSGIQPGGAFRVTSDVPIIAYQFNPISGSTTTDASLLYPVTSWDSINHVVQYGSKPGVFNPPYVIVIAAFDGTMVDITSGGFVVAGGGVPAATPGDQFMVGLDEGDIVSLQSESIIEGLTGTKIVSDPDHPVAVIAGHHCGNIPPDFGTCDHLEEQIAGVRQWGTKFVASRVPVRDPNGPDTSMWHVYAAENGTTVTMTASANVTGVPAGPQVMQQGDRLEFFVGGTPADPGDFVVEADKPIAVFNYMTGAENLPFWPNPDWGDPAMVQMSATDQYLPRYVVFVPTGWDFDHTVITRLPGSEVRIDGNPVPNTEFISVGDFEVGRPLVTDGVHLLEGDDPFQVVIVGYASADSYAYLGGTGTAVINPDPEG